MELKLDFLKGFIDESARNLTPKTSRRYFKAETKPLTTREKCKPITLAHKRLYSADSKIGLLNNMPQTSRLEQEKYRKILKSYAYISSSHQSNKNLSCDLESLEELNKKPELSLNAAETIIKAHNNKVWMQKHNSRNNDEGFLINFAEEFFKELDKSQTGYIIGKNLLERLLSLGIATDSHVLKETLSMIFHCADLDSEQISLQAFISMFRPDLITDLILSQLNERSLNERRTHKILSQLQQKNRNSDYLFSRNPSIRHSILSTPNEIAFHSKTGSEIITINEHLTVIEKLYQKFSKSENEGITILTACEVFKFFKIFSDNFECKKYITSSIGHPTFISFRDFQKLFARSMLKGAFVNLSKRLFEGNYAEKEMSSGFKINAYQRALLMSGVRCPNSNISVDEGERIVLALEKFKNVPKVTYEELRKKLLDAQGIKEDDAKKKQIRMRKYLKVKREVRGIASKLKIELIQKRKASLLVVK